MSATKRWTVRAALTVVAFALGAGAYLIARRPEPPHTPPVLPANAPAQVAEVSSELLRAPLDSEESLLVEIVCEIDAPERAVWHTDDGAEVPVRLFGDVHYGIGSEAQRIENWLDGAQYGDARHALWSGITPDRLKGSWQEKLLVPAALADGSLRVAVHPNARPKVCNIFRMRTQADSAHSVSRRVQQVATQRLRQQPRTGWETVYETVYTRASEDETAALQLTSPALRQVDSDANWWMVVWFDSTGAAGSESLVIVGVLSGRFVSRDGTIVINAGEAACLRIVHTPSALPTAHYLRQATLEWKQNRCALRWDASISENHEPLEVHLYRTQEPSTEKMPTLWDDALHLCVYMDPGLFKVQKMALIPYF